MTRNVSALPGLMLTVAMGMAACQDPADRAQALAGAKPTSAATAERTPAPVCQDCGTIVAIDAVSQKGEGTGAGAVAGAVAGGVAGHQFGQGRGQDAATAAGAVGGAVAGHQIERQIRSTTIYRITVRMEDDSTRVVELADVQGYAVGAQVRVVGGTLAPR